MLVYQGKNSQDGLDNMNKEEIEQGMKCCNEFLCGECPYENTMIKKVINIQCVVFIC